MCTSTVESVPRTLRCEGYRAAYYPDDMSLHVLKDGDRAPVRRVTTLREPSVPPCSIQSITLFLTHECNLACSYCYVQGQGRGTATSGQGAPTDVMSDRTACRALDLIADAVQPRVGFFGGEPMLAWGRLRWAVERVEAAPRRYRGRPRLHVTTNGTLIDAERAAYLAAHGFTLIVSIDGPRELHDTARVRANGDGTYDDVIRGLHCLRDAGLARKTSLRGTVSPGERLEDFVTRLDHLNSLCDNGLGGAVSVEPATYCAGHCGAAGPVGGYERGEVGKLFDAGVTWALSRARSGRRVRWMHLTKTLDRLLRAQPAWTECGAARGHVGVSPDGTVHACHHEGCVVGNVRVGLDTEACAPWMDNRLTARERCARCWARHLCGGGCRMEGWHATGRPSSGRVACTVAKARSVAAIKVAAALTDEPKALALIDPKGGRACG